jgi:hypothetical protein
VSIESVRVKAAEGLRDLIDQWSAEDGQAPAWTLDAIIGPEHVAAARTAVAEQRAELDLMPPDAPDDDGDGDEQPVDLDFWVVEDLGLDDADDMLDGDLDNDVDYLVDDDDLRPDGFVPDTFEGPAGDDFYDDDDIALTLKIDASAVTAAAAHDVSARKEETARFTAEFDRVVALAGQRLAERGGDAERPAEPPVKSPAEALASLLIESDSTHAHEILGVDEPATESATPLAAPTLRPALSGPKNGGATRGSSKPPPGQPPTAATPPKVSSFVDLRVPLRTLVLDPGDELPIADDPLTDPDGAAFIRAFSPVHAYRRLRDDNLEDLVTTIVLRRSLLAGHLIVRPYEESGDDEQRYVVVDGSRRVAALRWLQQQSAAGQSIPHEVETLFGSCPVKVIQPGADPALVLAMMGDPSDQATDPWFHRQHRRVLVELSMVGFHDPARVVDDATQGDRQVLRRYHAYKALQQMMLDPVVSRYATAKLFPIFHEAVGRPAIREWLDWNNRLFEFTNFDTLDQFFHMLVPQNVGSGRVVPPQIASRDDVSLLSEVLRSSAARRVLDDGGTLVEALQTLRLGARPAEPSELVS